MSVTRNKGLQAHKADMSIYPTETFLLSPANGKVAKGDEGGGGSKAARDIVKRKNETGSGEDFRLAPASFERGNRRRWTQRTKESLCTN